MIGTEEEETRWEKRKGKNERGDGMVEEKKGRSNVSINKGSAKTCSTGGEKMGKRQRRIATKQKWEERKDAMELRKKRRKEEKEKRALKMTGGN